MESWLPAVFGFGGVLVGSLFSLWLTKLHLNNADKRFERELLKAKEDAQRQRKWEVRSKPLLKLRAELARMASKQDILVVAASRVHTRIGGTDEEAKNELKRATDDWNAYLASGDFFQSLFMQYDTALVNQVEEITKDYQKSYFYHVLYQQMDKEKLLEAMKVFERNRTKIVEVQELINKRLEEL